MGRPPLTEFPGTRRIEGTTRQDNQAMLRAFRKCGYLPITGTIMVPP
jgi:RimJ/RimL family protein N-acetyltransferase